MGTPTMTIDDLSKCPKCGSKKIEFFDSDYTEDNLIFIDSWTCHSCCFSWRVHNRAVRVDTLVGEDYTEFAKLKEA